MSRTDQRGIAHLLLLIPLLAGIILVVYLINQKTNLFPWAASNPVSGPVSPSPSSTPNPSPAASQVPKSFGKAISLLTGSSTQDLYLAITRLTNQYDELLLKDPFTVEFWFRINKLPDQQLVLLSQSNRLNVVLKNNGAGTVVFQVTTGNGSQNNTTSWATGFAVNEWHHFATMYKNGTITIFIDGKYLANYAAAYADDRSEIVGIGKASGGIIEDIDEVRISSIARYPSPVGPGTYQVPVAPFEVDSNTQMLFHMDGSLAYADGTSNYRGDITGSNNGFTKYIDSLNGTGASPSPISGPINPSPSPFRLGDADGDNDIDIFDYNIVLTDFGKNILPGKPADFDKDGDVDIFDYNIILTYFGT